MELFFTDIESCRGILIGFLCTILSPSEIEGIEVVGKIPLAVENMTLVGSSED